MSIISESRNLCATLSFLKISLLDNPIASKIQFFSELLEKLPKHKWQNVQNEIIQKMPHF